MQAPCASSGYAALNQYSWLKHRDDMGAQTSQQDKTPVPQSVGPSNRVNEILPTDPTKILDIYV